MDEKRKGAVDSPAQIKPVFLLKKLVELEPTWRFLCTVAAGKGTLLKGSAVCDPGRTGKERTLKDQSSQNERLKSSQDRTQELRQSTGGSL